MTSVYAESVNNSSLSYNDGDTGCFSFAWVFWPPCPCPQGALPSYTHTQTAQTLHLFLASVATCRIIWGEFKDPVAADGGGNSNVKSLRFAGCQESS